MNAVVTTADISGLLDRHVTGVRGVQDLGDDAAIGSASAGHSSGAADQNTADAGRAFLGENSAAGLANHGPGCSNSNVAKRVLNDGNSVRGTGNGSGWHNT